VVLPSHPEPNYDLLEMLNELFPDCEIEIVFREVETLKQSKVDSSPRPFMTNTIGRV
jgi:hypothetical protein